MSSTTTELQIISAARAALEAIASGRWPTYLAEEVPGTTSGSPADQSKLPSTWVEVGLTRSAGGAHRQAGRPSTTPRYLTVGSAARTTTAARQIQDDVRLALEGAALNVAGEESTALRFYDQDGVGYLRDLGRFWQITTYSLAI